MEVGRSRSLTHFNRYFPPPPLDVHEFRRVPPYYPSRESPLPPDEPPLPPPQHIASGRDPSPLPRKWRSILGESARHQFLWGFT
eukprot:scaffold6649_cov124-Isochrysis_galbana.AAC.5